MNELGRSPAYQPLVESEKPLILEIFEKEFNHKAFTGRSGRFFADVVGQENVIELPSGSIAYTFCQVPIILQRATRQLPMQVRYFNNSEQDIPENILDKDISQHIFARDNYIRSITIAINHL